MATPTPGYKPDRGGSRRLLASPGVQRAVRRAAERRGVPAFLRAAPRRSGEFAARVTVEDAVGWDGRPGVRIVVRSPGALAIEFGRRGQGAANALQAAVTAIERR